MADNKPIEEGFSSDGFITDQDCFSSVRYRTIPACDNGCGFIAAYNMRRFLGHDVDWDDVRREMDEMHKLRIPGPTLMKVMRNYLALYVPQYREVSGREEAAAAAEHSSTGIFRYTEGHVPHFICYIRQEDGSFRFFNVSEGLEDCTMPMERFCSEHLKHGIVILLYVEDTKDADREQMTE